jgi:nitrogen PTS system EIIA component
LHSYPAWVGFSASNGMSNDVQKPIRNSLLAEAVIFDAAATTLTDAVLTAVPALGSATGLDTAVLRRLLVDAAMEADVAIGAGVAAPHAPVPELPRPAGAFIRLAEPIDIGALDGQAVDLVFATLFPKSDPRGHLIFLARLARLAQGRVFRDGLRQAAIPRRWLRWSRRPRERWLASPRSRMPDARARTDTALAVMFVAGEKAVDSALLELIGCSLGDAAVLDAQSAESAVRGNVRCSPALASQTASG